MTLLTCVRREFEGLDVLRQRLPTAIATLQADAFPGPIHVVDDGSDDPEHLAYLQSLPSRFQVVRRPNRGGTAKAKNTCLRLIRDSHLDVGLIVEDDVEFLDPLWWKAYVDAHRHTGIQHFSWRGDAMKDQRRREEVRGWPVIHYGSGLNGVLLTVTQEVIARVGGLKILAHPWGTAHVDFTRRCLQAKLAPFFADVVDSNKLVRQSPHYKTSTTPSHLKFLYQKANREVLRRKPGLLAPLIE